MLIWNWLKRQSLCNKLALVSGVVFLILIAWVRVGTYFEGMAFDKSWGAAMVGVPVILFFACAFLGLSLANLVFVTAKKSPPSSVAVLFIIPMLVIGFYQLPLPTFTDGLRAAVAAKFDRDRLVTFADSVREFDVGQIGYGRNQELLEILENRFPQEMSMGTLPIRVGATENSVKVYYGGALVQHWGYAIVQNDECPIYYLPPERCQKVFDNVWVYHDVW